MSTKSGLRLLATALFGLICNTSVVAQGTASTNTKVGEVPVKDFIRQPDFSEVTISPDGKYIAALAASSDKPYENLLAILDAQTGKILNVIHSGNASVIASYLWANNNRIVASPAVRIGGLDAPERTGELFAINADGSDQIDLFGFRVRNDKHLLASKHDKATIIGTLDENRILISVIAFNNDPDNHTGNPTQARILNVQDGSEFEAGSFPPNSTLIADHDGNVRAAFTLTPNRSLLFIRAAGDHLPNAAPWVKINDSSQSGVIIEPIGFNRDNSKLYVRVDRNSGPESIDLLDIPHDRLIELFQGKFADPGDLLPTADGKDYYAVISQSGERSLFYLDENSPEAKLNKALAVNFPDQLAYFSSFTRDGKHAIVTVVSDRNPGDFYVFDLSTRKARYLMSAMPWIHPAQMRPMQPITLNARDGLILHGFLTLPVGTKPYPLIVLPHGGPVHVSDIWNYDAETQLFASRGYAVLQVNYRGSGDNGAGFEALGFRQWGLAMQDDLTDATHWAVDQGYADPKRICIYGASYGGYAALEGAVREPDLYKCAIGYDGTYDLRVQVADSDTDKTDLGDAYLKLALGANNDDLLRRSPLSGVDRIKANILLLHGGEDPRTPIKSFEEFTKALHKSDKHYETLVEPNEGHGFWLPEHKLEAYQKMIDFLDQNIGEHATVSNGTVKSTASP